MSAPFDTLLLDRDTWDLTLDSNGNIAVASPPYALAQDVASAIRLFEGELWYDTTKGVPYFSEILGEIPSVGLMKARFVQAALTVPGIVAAVAYLDGIVGREVMGQVQATDEAGALHIASI